jgi:thioredoxin-related protein
MKSLLAFALATVLGTTVLAQTKPATAQEVLNKAVETAKAQKKNILIHFGASWCSWCKHLDAMLESQEVGKLFHDNFVITHLTIQESKDKLALENPGAQEMADAAGAKDAGVPVYMFFDQSGNRIATSMAMPDGGNIGHPATPEEIKVFIGLLEKTAPRMTAAERQQVTDYLAKQKYGTPGVVQ